MVTENQRSGIHVCSCSSCREHPRGAMAREHRHINQLLAAADERLRRRLAGFFARQRGRGGVSAMARITGLSRNTIAEGQKELSLRKGSATNRVRKAGAGRKRVEEQRPES